MTPKGRLVVLAVLLTLAAAQYGLKHWVLRSVAPSDSFLGAANYYLGYVFMLVGALVGPLWAVLEDRTISRLGPAIFRGLALMYVVAAIPGLAEQLPAAFGDPRIDWGYRALASTSSLLTLLFAVGFVLYPSDRGVDAGRKLPEWLAGTGGRLALLATLACVELIVVRLTVFMLGDWQNRPGGLSSWIFFLSLPLGVAYLVPGLVWSVLDDRRTEQPWFAALRGMCLYFFVQHIGGIANGLSFLRSMPEATGTIAAEGLGIGSVDVAVTVLSILGFLLIPTPSTRRLNAVPS